MYEFLTGPALWLTFIIFFGGVIWRAVWYVRGLDWQLDRVAYGHHNDLAVKGAVKSILHWLLPFGTRSWRVKPGFTLLFFTFHIGLLLVPVFLIAHNVVLKDRFGISLWTLNPTVADVLSIAMLVSAVFIVLRRIALPEVRILTTFYDYLLILISTAPFITGLLCRFQVGDYNFWLLAHILTGEIWLLCVPFTKLSHAILFFMSRAQLGMDYGIKRGGRYGRGLAW